MPPTTKARSGKQGKSEFGILLIGLFKLFKALLLVFVGIGAHHYLHRDLAASVSHWVNVLQVDPDNRYIHRLLTRIFAVTPKQLKALSIGTFIYAGLLSIEGVGLLMRKHWAEYFTVISTGALIPLEIYELARKFTPVKVGVLGINIAIVVYLIARLRKR
ncbi:MAG: hypothetical protein JWO80_4104 [Bryobacterales bacterium]|nr:hypothetical protein [Bryobacterales bacterium]